MLWLKKVLAAWFMNRSAELGVTQYQMFHDILLDYAKAHGFQCKHRFTDCLDKWNRPFTRCELCGEHKEDNILLEDLR